MTGHPPDSVPDQPVTPPPYQPPYASPAPYQVVNDDQRRIMEGKGKRAIAFGAVWILFGLVVTLYTLSRASAIGGGPYLLFWGPLAYGVFRIFQGWRLLARSRE
jgi:hypothetical protein